MNRPTIFRRFIALALMISLGSALLLLNQSTARAQSSTTTTADKVSPDLRQLIQSGNSTAQVRVIVQYNSSSTTSSSGGLLGLVGSLLRTVVGVVEVLLSSLNIAIVKVQANSVDVLAADPNVSYISLDTEVRSFGHVTTTTGAQQIRSQKNALGLNYTLDGSGVNIAVLDSGIDVNHKSFSAQIGKVVFSKDFTGENRTDDP